MLRIDRATGRMSVTPIISWREAEFIAAYDKGAQAAVRAAVADRARDPRVHHAAPAAARARVRSQKNAFQMTFHDFDWRLNDLTAAARARRTDAGGSRAHRQDRHRHRIEPRSRAGERPRAGGRGLPRVHLRARRGAARPSAAPKSKRAARRPDMVLAVQADVSTAERHRAASMARTVDRFGGVDILVNNVGKAGGADIARHVRRRVAGGVRPDAVSGDPRLAPRRAAHAQRGGGVIMLIASIWGRESGGRMTYNAVKAAEISLGKALAQQLAPDNIRVNSVAPGSILFPGRLLAQAPAGRSRGHRGVRRARAAVRPLRPAPTKSATSSRSSPRRARAGSAAPA